MKTLFWKIIGFALQMIGIAFGRSDVLFLGYYLGGAGKPRSLPKFTYKLVINDVSPGLDGYDESEYFIHTFKNTMLYTTLGKSLVKVYNDNILCIKDDYLFYPNCKNSNIHFSGCTCEDKVYSCLHLGKNFPNFIPKICMKLNRYGSLMIPLGKFIWFHLTPFSIYLDINDEYWINKGEPFQVYTEINM